MIRLENVYKRYDKDSKYVIDDLSLFIDEGEICVFIGPSGCGKSTTLKMINKMIEVTEGKILVNGEDIVEKDPDKLRMSIGYVIQEIGLLPHKTVFENIAVVPKLFAWPKEKIEARVFELLETVGLDPKIYSKKYPRELSGGQMQRVGVVRAIAANPPILLMDEPFGAVDPIGRARIQDEFLNLQSQIKKTICFITHDIDEAIKMADKIAVFNEGKIVQLDTPKNILVNPINDFVREFIGEDRISKIYKAVCAHEVIEFIDQYLRKEESSNALNLDYMSSVSDVINTMLDNNTDSVSIVRGDEKIGVISFDSLSRYMSHLGGDIFGLQSHIRDS